MCPPSPAATVDARHGCGPASRPHPPRALSRRLSRPAVQSIHLIVDGLETVEPALTRVVDVHTGQPLSMRDVRETVLHLFAMSRFEDVRVDATREGGGVSLRFDMIGARPVDDIRFTGVKAPGIDEGQLRKAVTERAGPSPPVTRIEELSRVVEGALRTDGYLKARVTARNEPHGAGHTALVFDVQPGIRAVVGTINVATGSQARGVSRPVEDHERPAVRARCAAGPRSTVPRQPPRTGLLRGEGGRARNRRRERTRRSDVHRESGRHVRVVFAEIRFPARRRTSCRSSVKVPSTRTCSRIRPRASKTRSSRRATRTRWRRTSAPKPSAS